MNRPPIVPHRIVDRLRLLHTAAAIVIGIALGATIAGVPRIALAAILLVLFAQLFSLEALRVLVLSIREYRR